LVDSRYQQWLSEKTIWHAADLLSSAFVADRSSSFTDVAQFVIDNAKQAPKSLVALAEKIISPYSAISHDSLSDLDSSEKLHEDMHALRARLVDEPRNSIVWADLSRLYIASGLSDKAAHSMRIAVSLSPENRFILRCAGRLYLHLHQPKVAIGLLRRNPDLTLSDPWLAAAEISIASAAELPTKFAKKGFGLAEDEGFSDFARAELRSALATLEMDNGKNRRARQLFKDSLISPNENSLAQVEWAERQVGGIQVQQQQLQTPRSFEARGYYAFNRESWDSALENGLQWLRDESFSTRPAIFISYVATSVLERFDVAETVLRSTLLANPGNPQILNNLAFALIEANKLEEARKILDAVDPATLKEKQHYVATLLATNGLLLMREGFVDKGRKLYREAYELAGRLGLKKYRQFASIYLMREELLANTSEIESSMKVAQREIGDTPDPDVRVVFNRALALYKIHSLKKTHAKG
jgi:Tfp pilus assembly protein PilF